MSGSVPIQIRGTPGNGPPVGLVERQLAVEMNNGNLWVGVPVSIDPTGRIILNPRRIPAGGTEWQVLTKAAGAGFVWNDVGARDNDNTVVGRGALPTNQGDFNTAVGQYALYGLNATSTGNTAFGNNAAGAVAAATNSLFFGYNTNPAGAGQTNQIVIGAGATGHGSNTATIGAETGPAMITEFYVGWRDLLRTTEPAPFIDATRTGLANDNTVQDIVTTTLGAGYWLIDVRVVMSTSSATPWIAYEAGVNYAAGQTAITDSARLATASSSVYQAQFGHLVLVQAFAALTVVGSARAQNATSSGTWDCSMTLAPIRLM